MRRCWSSWPTVCCHNTPTKYSPPLIGEGLGAEYKKDELKNIYKGKGTQKEKERIYDMLMNINASQSNAWDDIKK